MVDYNCSVPMYGISVLEGFLLEGFSCMASVCWRVSHVWHQCVGGVLTPPRGAITTTGQIVFCID